MDQGLFVQVHLGAYFQFPGERGLMSVPIFQKFLFLHR